jgi:glycerol uptake facilitator-like aquaporin
VIAVFKGEKTLVFWVGLLVFGYSLAQFCGAIWNTIYFLVIYPGVYPSTSTVTTRFFEVQAVYPLIPLIISGVIFAVIGLYMMKKGVKQGQPSTQN